MQQYITLKEIQKNPTISAMVSQANLCLEALGYTDHGPRHVGYVARITSEILEKLDYPRRTVELGAIAGWVHDVGNLVNRKSHAQIGASLLMPVLREMGMDLQEVLKICTAVGNHDEESGAPVSELSAALIIADKVDAHRARVRRNKYDFSDIHDRVNYSIRSNQLTIDKEEKVIRFWCFMDPTSSVKEFLTIYLSRISLAEKAARFLGCDLQLIINDMLINRTPVRPDLPHGEIPPLPEEG